MNKYRFSYAQKYALWRAYDMKCFYCNRPLDFLNVTIDHILPEYLESNIENLMKIIEEYEIKENFPNFSINNYSNWVPSDGPSCNYRKNNTIMPKNATLFYISQVQKKIPKIAHELERLAKNREKGNILGKISNALESNIINQGDIFNLLNSIEFERTQKEPLVITFGLNIDKTLKMRDFPNKVAELYFNLCDLLEAELVDFLRDITTYSFHFGEPSLRDGETLSLRLVFPELNFEEVENISLSNVLDYMPWWGILEVTSFYKVYGIPYQDKFG